MRTRDIIWQHVPSLNIKYPDISHETLDNLDDADQVELNIIENERKKIEEMPKAILTPAGIVSLPEDADPFDFWVGSTNFYITKTLADIISNSEGVEYFTVLSPYRFKIAIGSWWVMNHKRKLVFYKIQKKIMSFFKVLEI